MTDDSDLVATLSVVRGFSPAGSGHVFFASIAFNGSPSDVYSFVPQAHVIRSPSLFPELRSQCVAAPLQPHRST
jgi:hypothetical protein